MSLYEKLNTIQIKLKAPKNQRNNFGNYNYRSCEDILEGVKPLLQETQTTLRLQDEIVQVGNRIYVKATATLSDGENEIKTSAFAREAESKKGMDESQVTGAASSYARKYALNGLFAIDDTKDADTNEQYQQSNRAPARKQPAPQMKGGESTPEEKAEMKNLLSSKKADGSAVFTKAEMMNYSNMRKTRTAQEVIEIIKAELQERTLPPEVEAVKEVFNGEVVQQPGFNEMENIPEDIF